MSNVSYTPVWATLVNRSLRMVGAYDAGKTPTSQQLQDALAVLNMMLKEWQVDNPLWLKTFATLFLNTGQQSYNLANIAAGGNHCATSYIQTTLANSIIAGANSAVLTSAAGMANTNYLGIADNNGLIEWFTATFSGATATLSSTMAVAATAGNVVYYHTLSSQIERPTRVMTAVRKLYDPIAANGIEVEIELYSRAEYSYMPNKTVTGKVVQAYYDPQLNAGVLYTWPTADTPNDKLVLTVDRPILVPSIDTDMLDVPQEWQDPITFCLAERMWWEYPDSGANYNLLQQRAILGKQAVFDYDREPAASQYQFDMRR